MKKIWVFISILLFAVTLVACDGDITLPSDLTLPTNITTRDITTLEPTTDEILETTVESDLVVQLRYIYNLAVEAEAFEGTYEEWLETVRGPEGTDGREVTFQVADGYIQWQYVGDDTWTNLLALSSLSGPAGQDGEDGKSAYDIYMENFPEYEGDEEQWIIDLINGDLTVTKTYIVTFDSNGGSLVSSQDVLDGDKAIKPTNPIRLGYTFLGWFVNEDEAWVFSGFVITEDITLEAKWQANTYDILFKDYNGQDMVISQPYLSEIEAPETPVKEGYTFLAWFDDLESDIPYTFDTMPLDGVTLFPVWDINQYTITFEENGGTDVTDLTADYMSEITLPTAPTNEGYLFMGWYTESDFENLFDLTTMPLDGASLYAKWVPTDITISFDVNGGSSIDDLIIDYNQSVDLPTDPIYTGYTFLGWFKDSALTIAFDINETFIEDTTLYASWQINEYHIIFKDYDDQGDLTITKAYLSDIDAPVNPSKEGYTFLGWFEDLSFNNTYIFDKMPLGDITLYPKWDANNYTITFNENGGSDIDDITAPYLSSVYPPNPPIKAGYTFDGWYIDDAFDTEFIFDTMPVDGLHLIAKWTPEVASIHFVLDGVDIPDLIGSVGDLFQLPQPDLLGQDFAGWYHDPAYTSEVTWTEIPAGHSTIYGKWQTSLYTITYEENGGSDVVDESHPYLEDLSAPTDPTKTDYVFLGWYKDSQFTTPFIFGNMPAENLTLYAKWADNTNPNTIHNQISQPDGSSVSVQGTVYGTMKDGILGYFIYDATGYVAIDADHSNLNIGDLIEVQGSLSFDGGVPFIINVTQVNVIQLGQAVPTPMTLDLADLHLLNENQNYHVYHIEGVLVYNQEDFIVFDPESLNFIVINPDSLSVNAVIALSEQAGSMIDMDMVYTTFGVFETASLLNYSLTPMSAEEQGQVIQYIIERHIDLNVYPGQEILLDQVWLLDLIDLTYSVAPEYMMYFDPINLVFLDTDVEVKIPVTFTLTIDSATTTFTIDVTLIPVTISSIAEVIDDTTQSWHTIEALVVMKSEMSILLKDDSGYLYAYALPQVKVGDLVSLDVMNDLSKAIPFPDGVGEDLIYNGTLSTGNPLGLSLNVLSASEFLALDQNDVHLNGEYVELRGFVRGGYNEAYDGWVLENEDWTLPLITMSHSSFEKLFDYDGLEVYMRGFLMQDNLGHFTIIYEGIRGDIRIPEYTDQEVVDVLEQVFLYYYDNHTFESFEEFSLPSFHPILGGALSWSFADPNFAYYDDVRQSFLYADTNQAFTLNISIAYGTASKTFSYSSQLNQINITPFADLLTMDAYQPVYIEGLVVFHAPDFIYLMNDLGEIVLIEGYNLDVYRGDEVLLYGYLSRNNNYSQAIYLEETYNNLDMSMVLEIYSRQNSVSLSQNSMSIEAIHLLDSPDALNNFIYLDVEGVLTYDGSQYFLETPNGFIVIDKPYEQVSFELHDFINNYVSVNGYLLGNKYNYSSGQYEWVLRFVGEPNDIELIMQTETEIFTEIENMIMHAYQRVFLSGDTIDFEDPLFFYPNVTLTYTPLDDTEGLFDFTNSNIQTLPNVTLTQTVNIQVDLALNSESYTFNFAITVEPNLPIQPTPISNLITDGQTLQYIQGQVIMALMLDYSTHLLMIDDGTGFIFITMDQDLYRSTDEYYNGGYTNDEVLISGVVTLENARINMQAQTFSVTDYDLQENVMFNPMSIADYNNLDLNDPQTYGIGYEITGILSYEITPDGYKYYLIDDNHIIRIITRTASFNSIQNLVGLSITLRVFSYGPDDLNFKSVLFEDRPYDSSPSVWLTGYDDQAAFELIKTYMIDDLNEWNPAHYEGDSIWYPSLLSEIEDAFNPTITYNVIQGAEFVIDNGNAFVVQTALDDQTLVLEVTVTINAYTNTFNLYYYIDGYTVQTLADLFSSAPGTEEIALEAIVINSSFGLHYMLIEGQVYALRSFAYGGYSKGEHVIILGQRRLIDGVSDYTYNIEIISQYDSTDLVINPIETPIENLYTNDYNINPLNQEFHRLSGFLDYDSENNLYILSNNFDSVYVRMLQEGWNYEDYLSPYIGEYVSIDVVLPMEMMRGNSIYIVDALGAVSLKVYTPEEDVALIKDRLLEQTMIDVYSGESIDDYIVSQWALHPYTYITYTLEDPLDDIYYDLDNDVFAQVFSDTQINLIATITYDDNSGNLVSDTLTLTFNIMPRPYTSILDVLYGQTDGIYLLTGEIMALGLTQSGFYDYAVISDGSNQIYIQFGNYQDMSFDGENLTLAIGDSIDVIGHRGSYDANGSVAMIESPTIIINNNTGNTITLTPITLTVEEALDQSFTDLTNFYQYVTIEGEFYWDSRVSH